MLLYLQTFGLPGHKIKQLVQNNDVSILFLKNIQTLSILQNTNLRHCKTAINPMH